MLPASRPPSMMPAPEPLPLIEATLAFTIQLFIARHPELLLPPEVAVLHPPVTLRTARHIVALVEGLHYALAEYRALLAAAPSRTQSVERDSPNVDDIPF
jgi:hypothetical protein